ncbi:MAG: hypothetical protein GY782_08700 [Gammaproteobacteria bacterium]|nr:hypothetical protein [Gammaproteobacteria bacterium]
MLELRPTGEHGKPLREVVYEAFNHSIPGEFYNYSQIQGKLGFDIRKKSSALYGANKLLLERNKKMLINVREKGYRIALHVEQIDHAKKRKKRSTKQIKHGVNELRQTDTSKMSNEEKERHTNMINDYSVRLHMMRKHSVEAVKLHSAGIKKQKDVIDMLDQMRKEMDEMKKKLD